MTRIPPKDTWRVGPANARKLGALGCESAADVRDLDTRLVLKSMPVVGERLVQELRGVACLDLEEVAATRMDCAVTRSFSERGEDRATMEQAVAAHATQLGEKLRREGLGTDYVTVFFHTSDHDRTRPQPSVSTVVTMPEGSNDTLVLVKAALHGVRQTWRSGFRYFKAGVVTTDLLPLHASQRAMPGLGQLDREQGAALMAALDACNRRFRGGAVVPAPPASLLRGGGPPSSRCAYRDTRRGSTRSRSWQLEWPAAPPRVDRLAAAPQPEPQLPATPCLPVAGSRRRK